MTILQLGTIFITNIEIILAILTLLNSIGYAVGIWESDPTTIHTLRHELGRKIEGTRSDFPYTVQTPSRAYANYYIDFQVHFALYFVLFFLLLSSYMVTLIIF